MIDIKWRTILKYVLLAALVIIILVVIKVSWDLIKTNKKEGFTINNSFGSEFDYVKSFINSLAL